MSEFSFHELPPEIAEKFREAMDQKEMHTEDNTHAVKQLLDSLDQDQLRALDLILHHAINPATNAYFRGRIEAIEQYKFDICPCGKSHDPDKEFPQDEIEEIDDLEVGTEEWHDALLEYNLYIDRAGHQAGDFELRCKGCEKIYPSLEDRMLREPGPGGCPRCIEKTKWG